MAHHRLADLDDWELVYEEQDIRGWELRDAAGNTLGTIDDLIVDTDTALVQTIALEDGSEYPAEEIVIGDDYVYLKGDDVVADVATPVVKVYDAVQVRRGTTAGYADYEPDFQEHYRTSYATSGRGYDVYEPAYRHGYTFGSDARYRDRDFEAVEPEMRRAYGERYDESLWEETKDAARHAYNRARAAF